MHKIFFDYIINEFCILVQVYINFTSINFIVDIFLALIVNILNEVFGKSII